MTTVLTTEQIAYVDLPPRPLIPQQRLINSDGTPTHEYHLFLTFQYEWERRLLSALTGQAYPRADYPPANPWNRQIGHGRVALGGAITTPSPFTSTKLATGKYRVTVPSTFPAVWYVLATCEEPSGAARYAVYVTKVAPGPPMSFDVWTYTGAGALVDCTFNFAIFSSQ